MLHARSRDGIWQDGKISGLGAGAKQKVSIVERKGPGWTGWLDSQGDGDCPICGTGSNSRHGSYVRSLQDLPAQGTSVLIQA
ncbi:MAG: zinc-finger of transposase, partial [Acetobacteraceae bacterium]|nr:zinc-finger of transposase [Acetobacteraceae bacterium]